MNTTVIHFKECSMQKSKDLVIIKDGLFELKPRKRVSNYEEYERIYMDIRKRAMSSNLPIVVTLDSAGTDSHG